MSKFDEIVNRRHIDSYKWDVSYDLPMWVADMDFKVDERIINSLKKRVDIGAYGYSNIPAEFYNSYKNFWYNRHNVDIPINSMLFTTGVVPLISSVVRKLTTVGENVVIMAPVYNIFYNSILNNGRNVLSSDLIYSNNEYSIDFVDLEKKLSLGQTTLMILCNPHNPIGKIWSKEELNKIGELCLKYNVILLSDEIHCDIVSPGKNYNSILSLSNDIKNNSIVAIAASKCFNMAGLQSACAVVINDNLRHKVWRGINTDEVAEPNFFTCYATICAFNECSDWLDEMNEYVYTNKKIFIDYINKNISDIKVINSEATYLLWVDVGALTNDAEKFTSFLADNTGLYVTAGGEYGCCGKTFFRINLATSKDNVVDALNRLSECVKLFKNR